MKTGKSLFALLLALSLCLGLCACGSSTTTLDTSSGSVSSQTEDTAPASSTAADGSAGTVVTYAADSDSDLVITTTVPSSSSDIAESDYLYISNKGSLLVGVSDFAPMDYQDANGEWTGFDTDMARAFAENLGLEIEFVPVEPADRVSALSSKTVDCLWNGVVLSDELSASLSGSAPYCNGETEGEVYVVFFRSGSDMVALCNEFLAVSYVGGTMTSIAARYGVEDRLIEQ